MKKKIYTGMMMALLAVVLSACGLHPDNVQPVNQLPAIMWMLQYPLRLHR